MFDPWLIDVKIGNKLNHKRKGDYMETYTAKDIIEMVIQAKERGIELYHVLAKNSENYHVGQLFEKLAQSGEQYKTSLEQIFNIFSLEKQEEAYPGERALYLKALVDANTFVCDSAKEKALEKNISEEDALQAAITFKKDFMLFLHDLKRHAEDNAQKEIDELIDAEVTQLQEMLHAKQKLD